MPEKKKISDISRLLNEERHIEVSPSELNLMLIATGDLIQTAIGKIETFQGRKHGILGEYRTPANKSPYWIPLYSEAAVQYVLKLANDVFRERAPKPSAEEPEGAHLRAPQSQEQRTQNSGGREGDSCRRCKLLINGECGMPRGICSFYEPCYVPTAQDIEIMVAAQRDYGVVGGMTQTALGDIDDS